MDSVKNYHLLFFLQLQDVYIQDGGIQIGVLLLSCTHATLSRAATFDHYIEDNKDTFRVTTTQPLRIHCPGRRRLIKFKNLLL